MRKVQIGAGVLLALTLVGCGDATSESTTAPQLAEPEPAVDVSVLYGRGSVDPVTTYESPGEAAKVASTVLLGTVAGYRDGPEEFTPYRDGTSDKDRHVVIEIDVEKMLKAGISQDKFAQKMHLVGRRGAERYDAGGQLLGARSPAVSIAEFEHAVPIGTRMIVMAGDFEAVAVQGSRMLDGDRGIPIGTTPLDVRSPQTMVVDSGRRYDDESAGFTFEEALADVEKALG